MLHRYPLIDGSWRLMRFDKPVGTLLLLWPTLSALYLAAKGSPAWHLLAIFMVGVVVMRAAGCVINDYWDKDIDGFVERTKERPLATKVLTPRFALVNFMVLIAAAGLLVSLLGFNMVCWSLIGLLLAVIYPLSKRHFSYPQFILALAFNWGIVLAFIAVVGNLPWFAAWFFISNALWTVMYDTCYALVDRKDDVRLHIKSSALTWGTKVYHLLTILQIIIVLMWFALGWWLHLGYGYQACMMVIAALFYQQHRLLKHHDEASAFAAFRHNQWVGLLQFLAFWGADYHTLLTAAY